MPKRSKIIFNKKKRGFFPLLLVETFTSCIFIINIQQKRHSAAKLVTFNKQIKMCVFLTLIAEVSKKKKRIIIFHGCLTWGLQDFSIIPSKRIQSLQRQREKKNQVRWNKRFQEIKSVKTRKRKICRQYSCYSNFAEMTK